MGDLVMLNSFFRDCENCTHLPIRLHSTWPVICVRSARRLHRIGEVPVVYAISLGLSKSFSDDNEMLAHGLVMYDALYDLCTECQGESHDYDWPPQM
jgi:hypothetical protein